MNGTQHRYIFNGTLVVDTGLHVGSGYGNPRTEATIVRDQSGRPYIPGSSFKGALRSTVENLIAALDIGLVSCQLIDSDTFPCITVNQNLRADYTALRESPDTDEDDLMAFLFGSSDADRKLCHTCELFGSPVLASKLKIADLPRLPLTEQPDVLTNEAYALARHIVDKTDDNVLGSAPAERIIDEIVQAISTYQRDGRQGPDTEVRHGVGIDRDTRTARERIKFDYEAVPPDTQFRWELILEDPSPTDLQLLAVGLQEMRLGHVPLGGNTSRGTGRCKLQIESITQVNFTDRDSLLTYLLQSAVPTEETPPRPAGESLSINEFFTQRIESLFGEVQED